MARAVPSFSISSLPPPAFICSQKLESLRCLGPQSAVSAGCAVAAEFQHGTLQTCSSSMRSRGIPRYRSGNSLLGQKLRTRVPPRLRSLRIMQVTAVQSDLIRVLGVVVKTGREALEAGSRLVPESVPRPAAQAGVALAGLVVFSLVLKSVLSTIIFFLAVGGIGYVALLYLSKDGSSSSGGTGSGATNGTARQSDSEALDEARRIMEKYK